MVARNAFTFLVLSLSVSAVSCARGGAKDPKRSANRVELAKDLLGRGQLEQAESEAERALDYDASNVEAHNVLGLVDYLRAMRNHRLLEIDDCLTGVDAEALRAELDEFLTSADRHFEKAIDIKPDYGEAWANRGSIALLLQDYEPSASDLERALSYPHALINIGLTRANLGWAYFHQKRHAQAAKELRQAEQFNPGMCVAKYRLGRVYFARKEWNKALEQFQAVANNKECPMQEAHLYLLKAYRALGLREQAPAAQSRCVQMAPRSCIAAQCRTVL
ncbi:MAG TPA: tetratricopeptide repeat protein [Kofleriaceae bacterium]|nr:tetratricopeptide repeat protein [Kofleriaceae bacterium]